MAQDPKSGNLPIAIAAVAMAVCCLGTVFIVSGGSGMLAWLGGFDPFTAVAMAVVVAIAVFYVRRRRRLRATTKEDPEIQQSETFEEDP